MNFYILLNRTGYNPIAKQCVIINGIHERDVYWLNFLQVLTVTMNSCGCWAYVLWFPVRGLQFDISLFYKIVLVISIQ